MGFGRPVLVGLAVALAAAAPAAAWSPVHNGGLGHDRISGHSGPDHISGREGPDTLYGRGGSDLLSGDNGPDILYGGAGSDTLLGGAGVDRLYGASGDDIESGGFGADLLSGGSGDDAIEGGSDNDTLIGGSGDDVLVGGSGNDLINGGAGNDRISADTGADVIDAGAGNDVIVVDGTAATRVKCGSGSDRVYVTAPPNQEGDYGVRGSKGGEGSRAADCEHIYATDAVLDPNQGVHYLASDAGGTRRGTARDDVLLGGLGRDILRGGKGNDVLWGLRQAGLTSNHSDVLDGGPGDDTIYGAPGFQKITGGPGDDRIQAGVGSGAISGGPGNDTIRIRADGHGTYKIGAGSGNDTIYARGGQTKARISCGGGHDVVHVDARDRVARDCERVIGTPAARRAATASVRTAPAPGSYAATIIGTTGVVDYWRLDTPPYVVPDFSYTIFNRGTFDSITGVVDGNANGVQTAPGVTDDGDTAWDSTPVSGDGSMPGIEVQTSALAGSFTYEAWIRPADSGVARSLLNNATSWSGAAASLVREADGSLHARISSPMGGVLDVQSAPLELAPGVWHHVAWTRSETTTALYADGEQVASAPATPIDESIGASWQIGRAFGTVSGWLGQLDEIAVYDHALDASTLKSHARFGEDGVPPVTTMSPAVGPLANDVTTHLVTAKGGSQFTCLLDGAAYSPCSANLSITGLAVGPHTLTVSATDRFGLVELHPRTVRFTVDRVPPKTIAAVVIGTNGDPTAVATFGSDKAAHFVCNESVAVDGVNYTPGDPHNPLYPCTSPMPVQRGAILTVVAIDEAGNLDPTSARIPVPETTQVRTSTHTSGLLPTFAGARDRILIAGEPWADYHRAYQCRSETRAWAACPHDFYWPILHAGVHELQVRQQPADDPTATVLSAPLHWMVPDPGGPASIVGLQFPAVLERGARLARRVPRVLLALNTAAKVIVQVVGAGDEVLAHVALAGSSGPNTVKVPASVLTNLKPGRYDMVVSAAAPIGPAAVQRLSFAVVPPAH